MAELPERRILKDVLSDLKAKTIRSRISAIESAKGLLEQLQEFKQTATKIHDSQKDKLPEGPAKMLLQYLTYIESKVIDLINGYGRMSEDDSTYIKWLEKYSTDLDSTFYGAIEKGVKEAEEQAKKQSELMSKKKDDYAR
jgi:hypothetical protein